MMNTQFGASRSALQEARNKVLASSREDSLPKRILLLSEASQLYLRAADEVQDDVFRTALTKLADSAISEALQLKEGVVRERDGVRVKSPRETKDLSRAAQADQWTVQANRIIAAAHIERARGLAEIPKASAPSGADILADLAQLEAHLSRLGMGKSREMAKSEVMPAPLSSLQQSTHTFSTLGESFMTLPDDVKQVPQETPNNKPTPSPSRSTNNSIAAHANSAPSSENGGGSFTAIAQLLPFLTSLVRQQTGADIPSETTTSLDSLIERVEWNVNSSQILPSSSSSNNKTTSLLFPKPAVDNAAEQMSAADLSRSSLTSEGVHSLIKTIATLSDENTKLEKENAEIKSEMENFRQEFARKFKDLKRYISDFKDACSADKKPFQKEEAADQAALSEELRKANERKDQLEQALAGVLAKYYATKAELQKKAKQLDSLKASDSSGLPEPSSPSRVKLSSTPSSSSLLSHHQLSPSMGAAMDSIDSTSVLHGRKLPPRKNPSTSTLVSLHKSTKLGAKT